LTFFGLTQNNIEERRIAFYTQIHEIVFYGKGGYDWITVFNMPIWLRKFTFHKLKEHYEETNKPSNDNQAIGADGIVKNKEAFENQSTQKSPTLITPGPRLGKNPIKYS